MRPVRRPAPKQRKKPTLPVMSPAASARHDARIAAYRTHYNKVGEALLGAVMRAMAITDATHTVNSLLARRFNLPDVNVDLTEITMLAEAVLKLEVTSIIIEHSRLPERARNELVSRIIARHHPRRDGLPTSLPAKSISRDDRVADIETVIARELKKSFPPGGQRARQRARPAPASAPVGARWGTKPWA